MMLVSSGGFCALNRLAFGIPAFYLWKAVSRTAHGGRYAEINGVRIYYETFGAGAPVLVLHGGTAFHESMHYQIRALVQSHFVIAPDSRGHGRSTDGEEPLSYARMADDMLKLLDDLQVGKADIVGWSDGGIIGLDLAMRHPERVGRLVAIGANYNVTGVEHLPPADASPDAAEVADLRDFYARVAPDPAHWPIFYRKVVAMWRSQPSYTLDDLAQIKTPTLVMAGEFDDIKREHTDALAKAIPGSRKYIVKDATHLAPLEQPDAVNRAIGEFLGSSDR
ncbi:MAG: alpha/beta hydrolase [Deltaproteobacteria bacterium]|nr:alpha/beta hydrolase [Deltaproteobacteria bacterium]MBI3388750.1 alpha/beta hydrolase [Deltaproteobacteria bacterium]